MRVRTFGLSCETPAVGQVSTDISVLRARWAGPQLTLPCLGSGQTLEHSVRPFSYPGPCVARPHTEKNAEGVSWSKCVGEGLVSRPHLLGESAQRIYYLTSGKLKGRRNCLRIMMNERRKVKMMKRSRKSERTLNSCMRHGDDHGME